MAKKVLARKGDTGYWITKLGVITRVKFDESIFRREVDEKLPVWYWRKNPWGNPLLTSGVIGKTVFISLEEANSAARAKLDNAIATAEKRLATLRLLDGSPMKLEGFEKKTTKKAN